MDSLAPDRLADGRDLAGIAQLAAELATLKRLRDARSLDSLASGLFRRAWYRLCNGAVVQDVALSTTAEALVALRLGGIDDAVMMRAGLSGEAAAAVKCAAFDEATSGVPADLRDRLRLHVTVPTNQVQDMPPALPGFVDALISQPRAGATCPGKPRLILEPQESHGDHCLAVSVLGVLLCAEYDADPAPVFLVGLAHHLHNAALPDAGFAGEMLLGDHLVPIMRRLTAEAVATLPPALAAATQSVLTLVGNADTPEGRAFNAADVIDRIMEVRHFAAVAGFTEAQALGDMQLVHAGPLQDFHHQVMRRAGLVAG